jgi:uncharacterized tellurite resistance protein B-like protein
MFFGRKPTASGPSSKLDQVISDALPGTDDATRRIVTAIAGLLGSVGYADRELTAPEGAAIRQLLQTVQGIGEHEAGGIFSALQTHVLELSTIESPRHARTLVELGDRDLRLHVLDLLVQVAAADGTISQNEVVVLRQLTTSLGLEQHDYNALQKAHRGALATLRNNED